MKQVPIIAPAHAGLANRTTTPDEPDAAANPMRPKVVATYDAAADHFDAAPLGFWARHGRRTVDLLDPGPGDHVLDVGCGTGASALPAAAAVGPHGRVLGIDVADNMLARARAKAERQGLTNLVFAVADMSSSGLPEASFDAVISVFSVFFVPDVERQVGELWRLLRPGGSLAVTVWARGAFEPLIPILSEEVRRLLPDLPAAPRPWERITDPDALRRLLRDGGTAEPAIHAFDDRQPLLDPTDWWTVALGSGSRWEIDQLAPAQRREVRARVDERLAAINAGFIETGALCAIARKPH